ncbi:hypothetical protein N3K66_004170 [Trichothecium roseum]|uniref:Uncharacterized protein n=1 Tax=Trichothecium roseum TaxID=47278 RepID=A0ACC0V260_9HYPO|nr:hypothetical protein N3K66_004170 [Trichothecium roseum]
MSVKHLEASFDSFITVVAAWIIAIYFQFFVGRGFALEAPVLEMPISDDIVWSPSRGTYVAAELADRPEPLMTPSSQATANASRLSAPPPLSSPSRPTGNLPLRSANTGTQRSARAPIRPSTPHPARAPMRPSTPHPHRVTNRSPLSSEWLHPAGGIEQYNMSANGTLTGLKKGFSFAAVIGDLERDAEAARAAAAANNQTSTHSPVTDTTAVAPQTQTGMQTQARSSFGSAVDNLDHSSNWTASSANIGANPARTIATSGTSLSAHDAFQPQSLSSAITAMEPYAPVAKDWSGTNAQPPHYFACDEPKVPPFSDESPDPFHNYQAKAPVFRDNFSLSYTGVNQAQAQAQSFSGNSGSSSSAFGASQAQTSAFSGNSQATFNSYQSQPSSFSVNSGCSASSASAFGANQAQTSSFPNNAGSSSSFGTNQTQTSAVPDNSLSASSNRNTRKNRIKSHLTAGARKLAARFAALNDDHGKDRPWVNPPGIKKLHVQKPRDPFLGKVPDKCDFDRAQREAENPSLAAKKETRPKVGRARTPKRKRTIDDNEDIEQTLKNMKPLTQADILLMEKKIDQLMEENCNLTAMNQHLSLKIADLSSGSSPVSRNVTNAIEWDNEARLPAHMRDDIVADLRSECEAEKKRLREKFDDVVQKRIDKVAAAYSKELHKRGLALDTVNLTYVRQRDELREVRKLKMPDVVAAEERPKLSLGKVMVVESAFPLEPLNPSQKRKLELDDESEQGPKGKRRRTK